MAVKLRSASTYIPALDGVRGLAALLVVAHHYWDSVAPFGWVGVDLFFVLSGFLITRIILENGGGQGFLLNFYVRRSLRIWPIYYLAIVIVLVINPWLHNSQPTDGAAFHLLYLQNVPLYWSGHVLAFPTFFQHSWTLAVEEQFYLLWPFLLLFLGPRALPALSFLFLGAAIVGRACGLSEFLLFARSDGLALGALLAGFFSHDRFQRLQGNVLRRLFVILLLLLGCYLGWVMIRWGGTRSLSPWPLWRSLTFTAIAGFFAAMVGYILCAQGSWLLLPLRTRPLVYLGKISYGIYLYHLPVLMLLAEAAYHIGIQLAWWHKGIGLAITLAVAAVSWLAIEKPVLRLKKYFEYRRIAPSPPVEQPWLKNKG